jgi:glycogen phosphorylase
MTAHRSAPSPSQVEEFTREFLEHLRHGRGVDLPFATRNDLYVALGHAVRNHLMPGWLATVGRELLGPRKVICYFSAEYLLGRQLENALLAADLTDVARQSLAGLGLDLDALAETEVEPGLGNGGLGRLAACFVDSLATLNVPAVGYGIRYEYGIFEQTIVDGWQVERPDTWLERGCPWEFPHPELAVEVGFGGSTEAAPGADGRARVAWHPAYVVRGVPYNYVVPGYRNGTVNTLRLWSARATEEFDLSIFNAGDYLEAVRHQTTAENISKVLYPEDSTPQGKELRLQQQYFFVACSLQDILRTLPESFDLERLPEKVVVQLNDTHPVIAIPELMRLLVDEKGLEWERAWAITQRVFAYTCHTLMPEALEKWPFSMLERLLPRHLQIILEINARFLTELRKRHPGDEMRVIRMSVVEEGGDRQVRMAHLATIASFRVNGVAELHSKLLRDKVLTDFSALWPEKFTNVTNGVTPRRFVRLANPSLSELVTARIGDGWLTDLERLAGLEEHADDPDFRATWAAIKQANKKDLAAVVAERTGQLLDPDAMFDVMVKRLHEYKRQLLKVLHVVTAYNRIKADPTVDRVPRVVYFGAKAAPGYRMAKLLIKLVNAVGDVVNGDPDVAGRLAVTYPPNYNVTLAERIIPACELSEQISMAGKEASGTGNMKFALNGALTIGTLDGANVEIRDLVGDENFFLFGLTEEEVSAVKASGYDPSAHYRSDAELRQVVDQIAGGRFSPGEPDLFRPIVESLLVRDEYLALADYRSYVDRQDDVDGAYRDQDAWTRMSILNVARCGYFSSDRAIRDYLHRVWGAAPR